METSLIDEVKKDLKDTVYGTPLVRRLLRPQMRDMSIQEVLAIRKQLDERLKTMGWRREKK